MFALIKFQSIPQAKTVEGPCSESQASAPILEEGGFKTRYAVLTEFTELAGQAGVVLGVLSSSWFVCFVL